MDVAAREPAARTASGRSLPLILQGEGPDLVLCEAGLGASGASWGSVLAALGPDVHAVAYDRAGYGRSAPAPGPRDLAALTADLLAVADAVPHDRLVLVGHSWGGAIARHAVAALRERGEEVAGLVLVDPAEELADLYFTPTTRILGRLQEAALPLLARLGLLAPLMRPLAKPLPEPHRTEAVAALSSVTAARAVAVESRHTTRGLRGLRLDPPAPLGVPVTVLSGRRPEGLGRRRRDEITTAHRARAAREDGRFVAAERSGHMVVTSEPHLVAEEIRRLLP